MRAFVTAEDTVLDILDGNHGGIGRLHFRRLIAHEEFVTPIDFVDYTVVPPGSTIGLHKHTANEEIYLIVSGLATVTVEGEERQLKRGSIAVVRSGQSHQLVNTGAEAVAMFVIQVRHSRSE
jgi:mannose-6-phosphate isomerase-like protein (cupin superfamily)